VPKTFDLQTFLDTAGVGRRYRQGEVVFSQGAPAHTVFYIRQGLVQLTVASKRGQKAVIGAPGAGEFLGEGCLAGQTILRATATATTDVSIVAIDGSVMTRALHDEPALSDLFVSFLLLRHIQLEADLAARFFSSDASPPPRRLRDYIRVVPD
jgi:CRP/FNR family cyclic AMP-dependent transcriptional regulator